MMVPKMVLRAMFIAIPQDTRKVSNKQSNLHLKESGKKRTKAKVSRRKKIIKIRVETNKRLKNNRKVNETKS